MIGPVQVYIVRNGVRESGLYYITHSKYSNGIVSVKMANTMAEGTMRDAIFDSKFASYEAAEEYVRQQNDKAIRSFSIFR